MTFSPRGWEAKQALDRARRAWLEQQGGFRKVEDNAKGHDRFLLRRTTSRSSTRKDVAKQALSLRKRGLSYSRIADELGCSYYDVYGWVNPGYWEKRRQPGVPA